MAPPVVLEDAGDLPPGLWSGRPENRRMVNDEEGDLVCLHKEYEIITF